MYEVTSVGRYTGDTRTYTFDSKREMLRFVDTCRKNIASRTYSWECIG